jgi:CheY-like chemotaxis protein
MAMIVEDDPMLGQIYCKTLEGDFSVELIENGAEALARLVTAPPEAAPRLVVLDINLPGVSGLKIYERLHARIQAEPALANMRIIVCSADSQATELLRDGVDLTLLKPVSPTQLRMLAARMITSSE